MAHVEKYKIAALGGMLHHYRRDREATLARENIDRERTPENYVLGRGDGIERVREIMDEIEAQPQTRAIRRDAVVMFDWVATMPPDVPHGREREFFEETFRFIEERYGRENVLGGWVHMDETTPHMHTAVVPVVEREDGRMALSAKDVLDRSELRAFHREWGDCLEREMEFRPMVELTPEIKQERGLARSADLETYQRANDRLERLRREEQAARERNRELERRRDELAQERDRERSRAEDLGRDCAEKEREIERVQAQIRDFEERNRDLEIERERIAGRVDELRRRLEQVRERASRAVEQVRESISNRQMTRDCCRAFREVDRIDGRIEKTRERIEQLERGCREAGDGPAREIKALEKRLANLAHERAHTMDRATRSYDELSYGRQARVDAAMSRTHCRSHDGMLAGRGIDRDEREIVRQTKDPIERVVKLYEHAEKNQERSLRAGREPGGEARAQYSRLSPEQRREVDERTPYNEYRRSDAREIAREGQERGGHGGIDLGIEEREMREASQDLSYSGYEYPEYERDLEDEWEHERW